MSAFDPKRTLPEAVGMFADDPKRTSRKCRGPRAAMMIQPFAQTRSERSSLGTPVIHAGPYQRNDPTDYSPAKEKGEPEDC